MKYRILDLLKHHASMAAAVTLLILLIFGVLSITIIPIAWTIHENQERIKDERLTLQKFLAASHPSEPSLKSGDMDSAMRKHFLEGETHAVILAALQERIQVAARKYEAEFRSATILPNLLANGLFMIGVGVHLTGSEQEISQTLHELESSQPSIFIANASLRTQRVADGQPAQLSGQFDVYGALWTHSEP